MDSYLNVITRQDIQNTYQANKSVIRNSLTMIKGLLYLAIGAEQRSETLDIDVEVLDVKAKYPISSKREDNVEASVLDPIIYSLPMP